MDWKAECGQLNLVHVAKKNKNNKYKKKKLKRTNASAYLVQSESKIQEGSPDRARKTMKERICETDKSGVKDWGSDRWWEQRVTVMRWYVQDAR